MEHDDFVFVVVVVDDDVVAVVVVVVDDADYYDYDSRSFARFLVRSNSFTFAFTNTD